jgi:AAA+ superfamily predicted ATPase
LLGPEVSLDDLHLSEDTKSGLARIVSHARDASEPLRVYLHGLSASDQRATAHALADLVNAALLIVDPVRLLAHEAELDMPLRVLLREADRWEAVVLVESFDAPALLERPQLFQPLVAALARFKGILLLSGERPWFPLPVSLTGVLPVTLGIPGMRERTTYWKTALHQAGIALEIEDVELLADRFRLSPAQIGDAVATAGTRARWRSTGDEDESPGIQDLIESVRCVTATDVGGLIRRVKPRRVWDDLVLPPDTTAQLVEICHQIEHRRRVLHEWGFAEHLSLGTGTSALFAGPPGTGKTTAAEIIANQLNLELYVVDLSQIFSKYIGETPKHIRTLFAAAQRNNAILFCDECDSLYGKRSEVRDSHDRYANIEVSQLLAEMDRYEGCAILATNIRQNMDDAFLRRLQFIVEFPFPEPAQRKDIWQVLFPRESRRDDAIDFDFLSQMPIAGGNIKNIVLGAAYVAAGNGGCIKMKHLYIWPAVSIGRSAKCGTCRRLPRSAN